MNPDILKGKWNQIQGDVKKHFGKLTDDQILQIKGDAQKFVGTLQQAYGYKREQAEREIDNFMQKHKSKHK